jgi:hypothetical protein
MHEGATLAQRWAELWNTDPHRMVEEVYAAQVTLASAGSPDSPIRGRAALHEVEDGLLELIPDHRMEILRVIQQGHVVVVELLIAGTPAGERVRCASPACVWWELDEDGLVLDEFAYFEWERRHPEVGTNAGEIRTGSGVPCSAAFAEEFAARLAGSWSTDPLGMTKDLYVEDCLVESLYTEPGSALIGQEALEARERHLVDVLPAPYRKMTVRRAIGEGRVLGLQSTLEGRVDGAEPLTAWEGSLLLTLDASDRILSSRSYLDWSLG